MVGDERYSIGTVHLYVHLKLDDRTKKLWAKIIVFFSPQLCRQISYSTFEPSFAVQKHEYFYVSAIKAVIFCADMFDNIMYIP